jgi:hypothetical protein
MELIRETPPDDSILRRRRGRSSPIRDWLDQLRKEPGVWFRYPEPVALSIPSTIRTGKSHGATEGEFEIKTKVVTVTDDQGDEKDRYLIWVRHTPLGLDGDDIKQLEANNAASGHAPVDTQLGFPGEFDYDATDPEETVSFDDTTAG